jgi:hypothetical protein
LDGVRWPVAAERTEQDAADEERADVVVAEVARQIGGRTGHEPVRRRPGRADLHATRGARVLHRPHDLLDERRVMGLDLDVHPDVGQRVEYLVKQRDADPAAAEGEGPACVPREAEPGVEPPEPAAVISATAPEPSVVRSTVGSWITTARPSRDRCTSSSTMSVRQSSTARRNAVSVFSGWSPLPPRWEM